MQPSKYSLIKEASKYLSFYRKTSPINIIRYIEKLSWGFLYWKMKLAITNYKIKNLINKKHTKNKDESIHKYDLISRSTFEGLDYGRILNDAMRKQVLKLESKNVNDSTIRDCVLGKVMNKDGSLDLPKWQQPLLLVLGYSWHLIATLSIALMLALSILAPMPAMYKFLSVLILTIFYLYSFGIMNVLTIRTIFAFKEVESRQILL